MNLISKKIKNQSQGEILKNWKILTIPKMKFKKLRKIETKEQMYNKSRVKKFIDKNTKEWNETKLKED